MRKKLLAVCFVLAAVLSLMTMTAMAADVAEIEGGNKYSDLQEAINEAADDATIKLLGTITSDKDITVNKKLKFVLTNDSPDAVSGHRLIFSKGSLVVESGAELEITGGMIYSGDAQTVSVAGGSLTVTDTTITNETGGGIGVKITQLNGKFIMNSGAVKSPSGCAIYQSQVSEITIKDGTITGVVGIVAYQGNVKIGTADGGPTIQATSSGTSKTITVGGKTVPVAGIALDRSSLVILVIQNGIVLSDKADAVAYISAGTINADVRITGGVFSSDVSMSGGTKTGFVPGDTHAVIQAGDYWLVEAAGTQTQKQKALVIRNGIPKAYPSLNDAITAANNNYEGGDTVVLLDNDDSSSVSAITKNMTLELGKYEIKSPLTVSADVIINGGSTAGITVNSGTVTIDGTTITNTGGAGITVSGEETTVDIKGGSVKGDTSAVQVDGGKVTIDGTTVESTAGIGVAVSGEETTVDIKGGSVKGGTSAVQVNNGAVTIDSTTVESTAGIGVAVSGEKTTVEIKGGSIEGKSASKPAVEVGGGTVTIAGTTVTGAGNGIDVKGGKLTVEGNTPITGTAGDGVSVSDANNENTEFSISGTGTITGGTNGVKINKGKVTISISGNGITGADNGIYITDGSLTVERGTITGETNGIYVTTGDLTVKDGVITGKGGNGIEAAAGTLTITGGTINGEAADGVDDDDSGNGIKIGSGSLTLTAKSCTITGSINGIYAEGGDLTVNPQADIEGKSGDGIKITAGTLTIEDSVMGSAIKGAVNGVGFSGDTLFVNGGTVTGAQNGIKISGGEAEINGGTIENSSITGYKAAGVAISAGKLTITGSSIGSPTTIAGSTYGILVESDSTGSPAGSPKLTIGKEGDESSANSNVSVTGPTALYFKGTFGTGDIEIYSGTFNSTDESNMAVDTAEADLNGFIYGGKFTSDGKKDSLPKGYLYTGDTKTRRQETDGTVITIDGDTTTITFYPNEGNFGGNEPFIEIIVPLKDGLANPTESDMPDPPTREGHVFDGWYTADGKAFQFGKATIGPNGIVLYAHWKQIFKIKFDAGAEGRFVDGGEPPEAFQFVEKFVIQDRTLSASEKDLPDKPADKKGLPGDPFRRDGIEYTFGGWFTESTGGKRIDLTEYEFTDEADSVVKIISAEATLYAHWGYKITFDPQGGSFAAETLESGNAIRVTNKDNKVVDDWTWPAPARDGWRFDGWFLDPEAKGTERVDEDPDFEVEADTTLYAHWTEKVLIELTADPDMLTSEDVDVTIILTADGAKFVSGEDGSVDKTLFHLTRDGEEVPDASVTHAEIVEDEDDDKVENQVKITVNVPQEAGKLTIKIDGDAFQSPPSKDSTVEVDVTYRIDFEPDGGTFTDEEFAADPHLNTDINGKLASLPAVTRRDTYYHGFAGWFIGDEDGNCKEKSGTSTGKNNKCEEVTADTVFEKNTTVHAHWDQLSFTVTFDAAGGEFDDGSQTRTANTDREGKLSQSDLDKIPELMDYTFDGWYTEEGDPVDIDTVFTENTTIYAQWMKDLCEITFDADGGMFADGTDSKTEEVEGGETLSEEQLAAPTTPRPGHAFAGWFIAEGGAGTDHRKCTEVTAGENGTVFKDNTTVHAHWGYEVTFYLNDGASQDAYDTKVTEFDGKLTEWPAEPTRSGYVFAGWYTDTMNGDRVDEEGYVFEGATTVYARWSQTVALKASPDELLVGGETREITLTIDTDDVTFVSGLTDSMFTLSGAPAGSLTVEVERKSDGKEVTVTLSEAPGTVGVLTITVDGAALSPRRAQPSAVDIAVKATVTFDPREGTVSPTSAKTGTDGKLTTLPTPTRDGYTFDGWYTAETGGEKVTTDTVFTSNATIYARWSEKSSSDPEGPGTEGPGTEGPGDSKSAYSIQIPSFRHGSVSTTHTSAEPGTWVTLTVIPESDYDVSWVYVDRDGGASVSLSQSGRRYSFTMPASDVTVDVRFTLRPEYNNFVPPQTQPQYQTQGQSQKNTQTTLPTSVFKPVTSRPAAALWDLQAGSWAYPAAQWAYQNGYLDTAADGTFRLNDTVSHMQLWRIMARWQGESALDDNSVTQWARKTGASKIGTASGAMTRQNMVEYLYQCYFLLGGNVSVSGNLVQYRDSQQIVSASAKNAWIWAVNKGIISGTPDGSLNPNGVLNRGEFASILMRLCQTG